MKAFKFLLSGILMGLLLIIFAVSIAYATFIENDYDAATARMLVYNAKWFEVLLFLMVINFSGMIFTKKLYLKKKLNILLIHLALIIIIIGAGLTRYIGYEGTMQIRNGQIKNTFTSADNFLRISRGEEEILREKVILSGKGKDFFNKSFKLDKEEYDLTIKNYFPNATQKIVESSSGNPILHILITHDEENHAIFLRENKVLYVHELGISFGDTTDSNSVHIYRGDDGLQIRLPLNYQEKTSEPDKPSHSKFIPFKPMAKYRFSGFTLILLEYLEKAELSYVPIEVDAPHNLQIVHLSIDGKDLSFEKGKPEQITLDDKQVEVYVGSLQYQLPFAIKLKEFQLERYPGSNSPSSFASEIELIDQKENLVMPYRIFMNNILSYKGYRFYQSSYHKDEKGTVLSVNHDYWGTMVTYAGYMLLFLSLILTFFTPKTRFAKLLKRFDEIRDKRNSILAGMIALFLICGQEVSAQDKEKPIVSEEHAAKFGKLQVQGQDGRMMPVNTLASEILVKIYKKDSYEGVSADQFFLEMITNPTDWLKKPMVKIGDADVRDQLGLNGEFARYIDFFTMGGQYKLQEQVNSAYMNKPALRSKYDKEVINVDERVNVYTMILDGSLLRLFPVAFHPDNTWVTPEKFEETTGKKLFSDYIDLLSEAKANGNYGPANKALDEIDKYQKSIGKEVVLTDNKITLEIFYNKVSIFKRLFPIYLVLGIVLTGFFFIHVFFPNVRLGILTKIITWVLIVAFLIQTGGLILRWYISGHAPWSNGYESMIYIAWVTMLAGLIFSKRSEMVLAVTATLAGITLLTAHMSWMNPEITNLVPVLKSYWLTIHVATITASYGFLGLGSMMAFMNLCIMIFRNRKNQERINLILDELTIIIEMTLMVGLALLIIGNFLGAIWANESWGRYWGWDPKETWTLVTIIFYSFVLHLNLIKKAKTRFTINFLSLIGFGTILMTYFGVNYYLSGLHSYAKGDPVPIPDFVYYLIAIILAISVLAAINGYRISLRKVRAS